MLTANDFRKKWGVGYPSLIHDIMVKTRLYIGMHSCGVFMIPTAMPCLEDGFAWHPLYLLVFLPLFCANSWVLEGDG